MMYNTRYIYKNFSQNASTGHNSQPLQPSTVIFCKNAFLGTIHLESKMCFGQNFRFNPEEQDFWFSARPCHNSCRPHLISHLVFLGLKSDFCQILLPRHPHLISQDRDSLFAMLIFAFLLRCLFTLDFSGIQRHG